MVKNKRALTIKPITTDLENVQVINKCNTCKSNVYTNNFNFFDNKILCPLCMDMHIKSQKINKVIPLTNLSSTFIKSNIIEEIKICKKSNNNTNSRFCWFF